jgi:hypothetical protein
MHANENGSDHCHHVDAGVEPPHADPPYPSAHNLWQDPLLSGPFSGDSYGMVPTSSSPAIDAGDNAACPATDIQGVGRPQDGDGDGSVVCDMGAYERWEPAAWIHLSVVLKRF